MRGTGFYIARFLGMPMYRFLFFIFFLICPFQDGMVSITDTH